MLVEGGKEVLVALEATLAAASMAVVEAAAAGVATVEAAMVELAVKEATWVGKVAKAKPSKSPIPRTLRTRQTATR